MHVCNTMLKRGTKPRSAATKWGASSIFINTAMGVARRGGLPYTQLAVRISYLAVIKGKIILHFKLSVRHM